MVFNLLVGYYYKTKKLYQGMKYLKVILVALLTANNLTAQSVEFQAQNLAISSLVEGTLLVPDIEGTPALAIIIGDSGPTDRNGNQNFMQNNAIKKLAEGLSARGVATFRYDKRIVKQIRRGQVDTDIMFDDFVDDAIMVLKFFKNMGNYNKIVLIGHGQGGLVGLLAARSGVDGFVSVAGSGKSIDQVIIDQVEKTAPMFTEDTRKAFEIIAKGQTTTEYPEALESIFNPDLQPFMANWMSYNPSKAIAMVDSPILIVNGTKNLQVSEEETRKLKDSSKNAEMALIENMNHVLVIIEGDELENSKSYNESYRPVSEELKQSILDFINRL